MTGFIYAIAAGDHVKIGWSQKPARRLTKLQSDNPIQCRLLGAALATKEEERAVHERFSAAAVIGEWFRLTDQVREFVNGLGFPAKVFRAKSPLNKLDGFLSQASETNAEFARRVGASEATISRLRNGKQSPSLDLAFRISRETEGFVTPNDWGELVAEPSHEAAAE